MSEAFELRKCKKPNCDKHCEEMEQNYDRQFKEMKKELKELQSMMSDLLKDVKDPRQGVQYQDEESLNFSIQSQKNALCPAESPKGFGRDNRVFPSTSVKCSIQLPQNEVRTAKSSKGPGNDTSGNERNDHIVDKSFGKIRLIFFPFPFVMSYVNRKSLAQVINRNDFTRM